MTRTRHVPLDVVQAQALAMARKLDARHKLGGLVDLPRLRQALRFPRELLDRALTGLHRQADSELRLSLANNPFALPDGGEGGIWLPRGTDPDDRSCFYYVALTPAGG